VNDAARQALLAYGGLLGLQGDALDDPALVEETATLLDALRVAGESDLDETPLPLAFEPPQP
jgi:hypothetical protein